MHKAKFLILGLTSLTMPTALSLSLADKDSAVLDDQYINDSVIFENDPDAFVREPNYYKTKRISISLAKFNLPPQYKIFKLNSIKVNLSFIRDHFDESKQLQYKQLQLNQLDIDKIDQTLNNKKSLNYIFTIINDNSPELFVTNSYFDIKTDISSYSNKNLHHSDLSEFFKGQYQNHKIAIEIDYKYLV